MNRIIFHPSGWIWFEGQWMTPIQYHERQRRIAEINRGWTQFATISIIMPAVLFILILLVFL